jgi:hypothetical protein
MPAVNLQGIKIMPKEGAPKNEKFPFPLNLENREEVELKLKKAQQYLLDLEHDDKAGTYPGGVPSEEIDEAKDIVERLEQALHDLDNPLK